MFDADTTGVVKVRRKLSDLEELFSVLSSSKEAVVAAGLPATIPAGGKSKDRIK